MKNYTLIHLHSKYSIGDSTTDPELYIEKAKELGMKAICFTEHNNTYNWIKKKQLCDKANIKFIMGVEVYLTKTLKENIRDNYHTILIAKNKDGISELFRAIQLSTQKDHTFYRPRLSFEEFCNLSDNIITTSACLGSPLANLDEKDEWYEKLIKRYDYLEIQPHTVDRQIEYNKKIFELSKQYDKPLISGTDTHEIDSYKQECRAIWLLGKGYSDDVRDFDLTFKSYDEVVDMYKKQSSLPDEVWLEAIENTNVLADMVDDFELDYTFKYPDMYEEPYGKMIEMAYDELNRQIDNGIIADEMFTIYSDRIDEEMAVFKKQNMCSFILFMSQLIGWCREQNIPIGFGRGSVTGSLVCYLLAIIDVDAIKWKTNFARFVNEGRISLGDIDTDVSPDDRIKVYNYIREQFTDDKASYITTFQKLKVNRIIDDIGRALNMPEYKKAQIKEGYKVIELKLKIVQKELENDKITQDEFDKKEEEIEKEMDEYMSQFEDIFKYYKGLSGAISAVGIHACFHGDTLITTKTGYKKIKDVNVGEMVLTHNNRYREVLDVMKRKSDDTIKVNVRSNRIIATKEHPFLAKSKIGEEPRWVRAEDLDGKYVGIHLNINSDSVEWNGVAKDINQYVKNVRVKNITSEIINSKHFMRFCGRFVGDGWVQKHKTRSITSICCAIDEFDELKEILDNIPFTYCYAKYESTYRFTLHDKELCEFMKQFGQGAKNKKIPFWIYSMSEELREAFLLGYFSADGHVHNNTILWNSVSKMLTLGIGQLATSVYLRPFRFFKSRDAQKAKILGREVNQNARYDGAISNSYSRFYFIEDGIMWVKAKLEECTDGEIDVYNLSVYEDNSYCADSVIVHNCGMIGSPISLSGSVGLYKNTKKDCWVSQCDMKNVDSVNYVKYDILSLKTLQVIRDAFRMVGKKYPHSYDINWEDKEVLDDMIKSPIGLFQMENQSSFEYLKQLKPQNVEDISFVNAIIRPSCASFRDSAIQKILNKNPTEDIDNLLSSTYGYLIYQEQIIEFLQKICGFTASEADTIRRCLHKDSLVTLSSGERVPIKDVKIGDEVICIDDSMKVRKSKVTNKWNNGVRKMIKIKTRLGYEIICTPDHKMLSNGKWVEAGHLNIGDCLYTNKINDIYEDNLKPNQRPNNIGYAVGALIGDGSIRSKSAELTNSEIVIHDKVKESIDKTDRYKKNSYTTSSTNGVTVDKIYKTYISGENILNTIKKYNIDKTAGDKKIPDQFMRLSKSKSLCEIIAGLFNTDGYVVSQKHIEYCTKSKELADNLQQSLLKLGIFSYVMKKHIKEYEYSMHIIRIATQESYNSFLKHIVEHIVGRKKEEMESACNQVHENYDIPNYCANEMDNAIQTSKHSFRETFGIMEYKKQYNKNIDKARKICEKVYCPETYKLIQSDLIAVEIVAIEDFGEEECYDIEVENYHNFIADGLITHNCIGKKDKALLDMWLPRVEEGYIKNSNKSKEEAIKDFHTFYVILQQASDYGFSRNHSIAYSMMTYLTAYVRYYYPAEFICAYINNATTDDDIANAMTLAKLKNITINNPRFGYSQGDDVVINGEIYRGVKNVLNVSKNVGDELYDNSKGRTYNSFSELLSAIIELPSTNKTNIETLIKIDYFSDYGKAKTLDKIFYIYQQMKGRKQMAKDSKILSDMPGIKKIIIKKLKENTSGYSCTAKMYKVDWCDIIRTSETILMRNNEDYSPAEKITHQLSFIFYIQDQSLNKYKIGHVKFQSKYGSWCVRVGNEDIWYKNLSNTDIKSGDIILINNSSEYKDARNRLQRHLMDIQVIDLLRKKQDKKGDDN